MAHYRLNLATALLLLTSILAVNPRIGAVAYAASKDSCDPVLEAHVDPQNSDRYMMRGNRCEGIYYRQVSGIGDQQILLVSLTFGRIYIRQSAPRTISISWKPSNDSLIHVRAYSLRDRVNYRMDVDVASNMKDFPYSLSMIRAYMDPPQLGLLAWTDRTLHGQTIRTFVPVRLSPAVAAGSSPHVLLVPGSDLIQLYIAISPVRVDGSLGTPVRKGKIMPAGIFPADIPIDVPLPELKKPGTYAVDIWADANQGGSATAARAVITVGR